MTALAYTETDRRIANAAPQEQTARHRAFHGKIAAAAEALAESKRGAVRRSLDPAAMPSETDPPAPVELPARAYPSMAEIIETVARFFRVTVLDMKSQRRTADIVRPRQVAMYLCRHLTPHSLPAIGRFLGGRDHTTVLHACHKIAELLPRDAALALHVATLSEQITGVQQ